MPKTVEEHLQHHSNRCMLILLSDSQLDKHDCQETLLYYGSIKEIHLTSDNRAAFVYFECEHAPLLVARCFVFYLSKPEVPMPKGVTALLPGCSITSYLYLQHVPRALSSEALKRYFAVFNNRFANDVTIYRPGEGDNLSSRVVVDLHGTPSIYFHKNQMHVINITESGKNHVLYAIPNLEQLSDCRGVCENDGCEECNVLALKASVALEDAEIEKRNRALLPSASDDDDYSTPARGENLSSGAPNFPDITDEAEKRKWGIPDEKQVPTPSPTVPSPLVSNALHSTPSLSLRHDGHLLSVPVPREKRDDLTTDYRTPTPPPDPIQTIRQEEDRPAYGFGAPHSPALCSPLRAHRTYMTVSADGYAPKLQYPERREAVAQRKEQPIQCKQLGFGKPDAQSVVVEKSEKEEDVVVEESDDSVFEEPPEMTQKGEIEDALSPVITLNTLPDKAEDTAVEESVDFVFDGVPEMDQSGEIEEESPPAIVNANENPVDGRDVIVSSESEQLVKQSEEVVVEEEEGNGEEEKEDSESDLSDSVFSLVVATEERDSDDLLSGEEDQWKSVGTWRLSRKSQVLSVESLLDALEKKKDPYDFAAGDAPRKLVMMMEGEEEVNDSMRDLIDRRVERINAPTTPPTVPLEYEDTVSAKSNSDEDTIDYDTVSDSNTASDASSDTVVGEGGNGRYVVDPVEWDEADQTRYGHMQMLSTIDEESQEEDAELSICSSEDVFVSEERESMDGVVDQAEDGKEEEHTVDEPSIDEEEKTVGMEEKGAETVEEEQRAIPLPTPIVNIDGTASENADEKVEVEQRDATSPTDSNYRPSNKKSEKDSDDEEVLEMEEQGGKEEEKEEGPEGEQRAIVNSSPQISDVDNETGEKMEVEQRDVPFSSTPLHWMNGSEVDSDGEEEVTMDGGGKEEEEAEGEAVEEEELGATLDARTSENTEDTVGLEQRDVPFLLTRRSNELDSDDEKEEEKRDSEDEKGLKMEEEGEIEVNEEDQTVTISPIDSTPNHFDEKNQVDNVNEEEERDTDDEETTEGMEENGVKEVEGKNEEKEEEEGVSEGEQQEYLSLIAHQLNRKNEMDSDDEEVLEMEEEGGQEVSPPPIRRWSRANVVDQEEKEEDYRSTKSEYLDWLTREDGMVAARGDSLDGCLSDTEAEIVPLPSSLATTTWGKGIVVEKITVDTTVLPEDKGSLLVNTELVPVSFPNVRRNLFGRVIPTFGKVTVSSLYK